MAHRVSNHRAAAHSGRGSRARAPILAAALTAVAAPALAQQAGTRPDTVTVTAQWRSQDVLDVPAALSVADGAQIRSLDIETLDDLARFAPGFQSATLSPRDPALVMRGISLGVPEITAEPRVSVFQDGVDRSRTQASVFEFFDIQRVEVLRGPQSTLFGRNALTGAINIIQNKPDPAGRDAYAAAEAGNLDLIRLEAMGNQPLGTRAAVRAAGVYKRRDGHVENLLGGEDFGGAETKALRLGLRLEPAPNVAADIILNLSDERFAGFAWRSPLFYPADPETGARLGGTGLRDGAVQPVTPGHAGGDETGGRRGFANLSVLTRIDLDPAWTLDAITAYAYLDTDLTLPIGGAAISAVTTSEPTIARQFSQELRLRYAGAGPLSATAGVNLFLEEQDRTVPIGINEPVLLGLLTGAVDRSDPQLQPAAYYASAAVIAPQLQGLAAASGGALSDAQAAAIAANFGPHHETYIRDTDLTAFDVFADAAWQATERLELQAGLRLSLVEKTTGYGASVAGRSMLASFLGALGQPEPARSFVFAALAAPGAPEIPQSDAYPLPMAGLFVQPTAAPRAERSLSDAGVSWRATARYTLGPRASLYANIGRGRRPALLSGAFPAAPGDPAVFSTVAAETVDSAEVGYRLATAGGLYLSAAAYAYRYEHFQTRILQGAQLIETDAGEASAAGLELEARAPLSDWAETFGAYSYIHARFGAGLYEGNRFRLTPDHALTLGLRLHGRAGGARVELTPIYQFQSRTFFDDANGDPSLLAGVFVPPPPYQRSQPPYSLVSVRASIAPEDSRWRLQLSADNLFDKTYLIESGGDSAFIGLPVTTTGLPRTFSAQLSFRY